MKSKRIIASMLLVALALCCFAGCAEGASKAGENGLSSDGATGTRSNPYKFGDEITLDFYSMPSVYSDWINGVATIKFMEFIDSAALKNEYPNHSLDEYDACIMAYVQISELSSDQALSINDVISTHYITNNLRSVESGYSWQSQAINGDTVSLYSAGSAQAYTWVPLDELQSEEYFSHIVIEYRGNKENTKKEIWIAMPATDGSTVTDSNSTEAPASVTTPELVLSASELESLLKQQPVYIVSTEYVVQDNEYKALYPDMLEVVFKNASNDDIRDLVIAFVAWDKNGLPVKIKGSIDFSDGGYVRKCNYEGMNLIPGESGGGDGGMSIDEECNISTFKAIVYSYTTFEDETWENPYFDAWCELYEGKKLS